MIRIFQFLMFGLVGLLLTLTMPIAWSADGSIVVDARMQLLTVSGLRKAIVSDKPDINVFGPLEKDKTALKSQGQGSNYYWSLFSFQNNDNVALDFILAIEPQRFPGSGIWPVALTGPQALQAFYTRDGLKAKVQVLDGVQTIALHIASQDTVNVAVESLGPQLAANLWRSDAFQNSQLGLAFYKGLVEGLILLTLVGLLALYSNQPSQVAVAGLAFAFAMAAFVESDIGVLATRAGFSAGHSQFFQPLTESMLVAAGGFSLASFLIPVGNRLGTGFWKVGVPLFALANSAYALAEPLLASSFARIALLIIGFVGLVLSFIGRGTINAAKSHSRLFWFSFCGWLVIAGLVAWLPDSRPAFGAQFASTSALLLLVLCIVLLRIGAAQGLGARPFITEATMRSLALSSGRHVFWNWQPQLKALEVGKELGRILGLSDDAISQGISLAFRDAIHPLDLAIYQQTAERLDLEPGERVTKELRLRQGDGAYRWFELQARAVASPIGIVDRCIGTLTDIGRLKDVEERLATDSLQDQLTGLATKPLLLDRLERGLVNVRGLALRVIVVDIDRFQLINEGLGHEVGDKILRTVGSRLKDITLAGETLARLAGGQFAILTQEIKGRGDFQSFADEIGTAVSQPIVHGGQQIVVTASVGISPAAKGEIKPQDLLDQAHVAMLEARAEGGSQAVFYHAEMIDDRARLLNLEGDLRRAISHSEITIFYQPIVYLGTLGVIGFEALARWQHPELGLLPPSEFIEVAETAGMMREMGLIMLQGAARQLGIWQRLHRPSPGFFVSVNVSASQISNPEFPAQVAQILARENLESGSLKLEITETVLMRQPERSIALLQQLRALGIGLACDDFGTGYSSLSSLRDFPFDTLKIDRSFINLEHMDERNTRIISSITTLAQNLNMVVVAEGIETQEQIDRLAELGVGYGQGYFIGVPSSAETASEMLQGIAAVKQLTIPVVLSPPLLSPPPSSLYQSLTHHAAISEPNSFTATVGTLESFGPVIAETESLPSLFALTRPERDAAPRKLKKDAPARGKKIAKRKR